MKAELYLSVKHIWSSTTLPSTARTCGYNRFDEVKPAPSGQSRVSTDVPGSSVSSMEVCFSLRVAGDGHRPLSPGRTPCPCSWSKSCVRERCASPLQVGWRCKLLLREVDRGRRDDHPYYFNPSSRQPDKGLHRKVGGAASFSDLL